jgi:glycosyl hydrolase family 114
MSRLAAIAATLLAAAALAAPADAAEPPPANARFDYQIGGDYRLPSGVRVVARDWRAGKAPRGTYAICYVNAFQTQDDESGIKRPDERSAWPDDLVLTALGDDPNWGGEYLVDISTADKRERAADWLQPMIRTCKRKGFDAVEYDNLDSWTRFDDTPREGDVPFGKAEAIAFAALITKRAHKLGLAVGQKNTVELTRRQARRQIGFDFAIAEECGRWDECQGYRDVYGNRVIAIEYRRQDFEKACAEVGSRISVVLRDIDVTRPGSSAYVYDSC